MVGRVGKQIIFLLQLRPNPTVLASWALDLMTVVLGRLGDVRGLCFLTLNPANLNF